MTEKTSINNNKRIVKNTVYLYVRMGLVLLVSLYTQRVVLHQLGEIDYGIYNVVAGFVSMLSFFNVSLSNGVQRFYNYNIGKNIKNGVSRVYTTSLIIQLLITIILLILFETVGLWYLNSKMIIPSDRIFSANILYQLSIFSLFFVIFQIPFSAATIAYERMNFFALAGIIDVVLKLLIVILLPILPYDKLICYAALHSLISFSSFILFYFYCKSHFNEMKIWKSFDRRLFYNMLSFSGWNIFGTFSYMIKGQGLNLLLNLFFGPIVNAARGISSQVMSALQGFSSNIVMAFRPQLVQSYASGNFKRVKSIFFTETKITFILMSILIMPIMLEVDYILQLWLIKVPSYTSIFTILVLLNMLITTLNTPLSQIVHASGRMKVYQITTGFVICSILPTSWLFLKLGYGPISVFVVSLFITIINQIICMIIVNKIFRYNIMNYLREVISPCCIFAILTFIFPFIIRQSMNSSFIRLLIIVCTVIISAIFTLFTIVLNDKEKTMIKNYMRKTIRFVIRF